MIMSDTAQHFVCEQIKDFHDMKWNQTCPLYHPSSNGLAEIAVQIFNELRTLGDTLETKLYRALFSYRITTQETTRLSPAEMMMGENGCTLDLIRPDLKKKMDANKQV